MNADLHRQKARQTRVVAGDDVDVAARLKAPPAEPVDDGLARRTGNRRTTSGGSGMLLSGLEVASTGRAFQPFLMHEV
ncbi:hypothetical protein [Mesorhizobium sp.]|uniref:hypothetical protein n=1 Tax=Mesorhizobium sp. TaxID=1871066 RepID=UPI0025CEB56B|nr:hypothetical protein [Mesorhizobium sp.]